ncbi:hypothetical protein GCM10023187_34600 [Nibrella viscosa]|uniref:Uncharacterized protein n=1 Tax=Nibrella viscosa TaxID=1084524 RepID=A0ABP8KNK3_9BACT
MKNYLVITLGTREIQLLRDALSPNGFEHITEVSGNRTLSWVQPVDQPALRVSARYNKEFPDVYTLTPRPDGRIILDNWTLFRPIIDWPLIRPALTYLKEKGVRLDVIMLVFTDQEEAHQAGRVKKRENVDNDTVYFADIIEKLIREDTYFDTAEIDPFGRYEAVTDMGVQYEEFARIKADLLYADDVQAVYLFPQGGIDQINQALTLRLIETFEGRVIYLQKAEGSEVQALTFPARFVDTLAAKAIRKHLIDLDFDAITESMHSNPAIFHKASYATKRLNLQYDELVETISEAEKIVDLYLAMKIRFQKQRKYNEFLWRAHTLNEVLFKTTVEQIMGPVHAYFNSAYGKNDQNPGWEAKLTETHPDLPAYLRKKKVSINNPNRWAYKSIYIFLCNNGLLTDPQMAVRKRIGDKLELLAGKRNAAQHGLGSITHGEVNAILGGNKQDYTADDLFSQLDQIFAVNGFGLYDTIKSEIEALI